MTRIKLKSHWCLKEQHYHLSCLHWSLISPPWNVIAHPSNQSQSSHHCFFNIYILQWSQHPCPAQRQAGLVLPYHSSLTTTLYFFMSFNPTFSLSVTSFLPSYLESTCMEDNNPSLIANIISNYYKLWIWWHDNITSQKQINLLQASLRMGTLVAPPLSSTAPSLSNASRPRQQPLSLSPVSHALNPSRSPSLWCHSPKTLATPPFSGAAHPKPKPLPFSPVMLTLSHSSCLIHRATATSQSSSYLNLSLRQTRLVIAPSV